MKQMGWDHNLKQRQIRGLSVWRDHPNYYAEGDTDGSAWTFHCVSCHQHHPFFKVNGVDSPIRVRWLQYGAGWQVKMRTDFSKMDHPCGGNQHTWLTFMDSIHHNGGGPFPTVGKTLLEVTVQCKDMTPKAYPEPVIRDLDAVRHMAGWYGAWGGRRYGVELSFRRVNWGDAYRADKLVIASQQTLDGQGVSYNHYVHVDGSAWAVGPVGADRETKLRIPWGRVLKDLCKAKWFDPPADWREAKTEAVYMSLEVKNMTPRPPVIGELAFTNFRVWEA